MIEDLRNLGLSKKEAEIYLALVKEGASKANKLAKKTNSNRTVTYNVLQNLIRKGLISYSVKDAKRIYQCLEPSRLRDFLKEKELIAKKIIHELSKIKPKTNKESKVEVYEGLAGLKMVHLEMLNAKEIRILNATGLIQEELKYSFPILREFAKKRVKIIANNSFVLPKEYKNLKNLKLKYFTKKETNYATTFMFDGTIIIQILKKESPLLIKIGNEVLYEGYKSNFDSLWSFLK